MDAAEKKFLTSRYLQPFLWFRYTDDIFFIWTHGEVVFSKNAPVQKSSENVIPFAAIYTFFIRKPVFCLSLNFLNIMLEIRLKFS